MLYLLAIHFFYVGVARLFRDPGREVNKRKSPMDESMDMQDYSRTLFARDPGREVNKRKSPVGESMDMQDYSRTLFARDPGREVNKRKSPHELRSFSGFLFITGYRQA
jgi:hypothetical protein